jgi:uncharacterized protein YjbI with pentapeptide repeats
MKIFKPDSLGLLHRGLRFARQNQLSVGMMAFFALDETPGAALLPEAQMWKVAAEAIGADAIMDEGLPKPAGEFLVFGAAHAPSGVAAPEVAVSAQIGNVSKTLRVSGDRHFNALGIASGPKPFTHMAISPQTAFGGPGSADNPFGKGLVKQKNADGSEGLPLPNVEHMDKLVLRPGDEAPAAGFWSLPPDSPLRKRHLGSFNDAWLKTTWPHLPDDTQPAYFNVAPPDQRLGGFFRGDEKIVVHNMHPQRALLSSALPQVRARCFINRRAGGGEEFVELPARAETVWLFPGQGCGIVLFRALAQVADEDADGVLHLLADWEDMRSAPLPLAHYHDMFLKQLAPQAAVAAELPPPVEAPPAVAPAAAAAAMPALGAVAVPAVAMPAMDPALVQVREEAVALERQVRDLMQRHGITEGDIAPHLKPTVEGPAPSLAEVEKMAQDLQGEVRELMKKHNITDADIAAATPPPSAPPSGDIAELQSAVQDLETQTRDAMRKSGITEQDVQKQLDARPELSAPGAGSIHAPADTGPVFAALAAAGAAVKSASPPVKMPTLPQIPEMPAIPAAVVQKLTREEVVARHAAGKGFASHDLSGLDLSALDLAGADFSGALLEGTGFAGSKLAAANFSDALLQGGDFSEADLKGAKFAGASAGQAVFKQAHLDGSDLSHADFTGADFSAASVAGAKLSDAVFDGAKMAGLKAAGCTALRTSFAGGDLAGADFARAVLTGAAFAGAKVGKASFAGANGDNADFQQADATGANFAGASLRASRADGGSQFAGAQLPGAQLERAAWGGAMMGGALFEGALLDNADFSDIKAAGANFGRTSAKGARFDKADLSGADFTGVNLHKGSLRKANTERTLLRKANLYGVDFYDTTPTIASLEGSNIDQTILLIRKPVV